MDRNRMLAVLVTAATALFVMAGAPGFRYRRQARIAAVAVYGAGLAAAIVWVVLWLAGAA